MAVGEFWTIYKSIWGFWGEIPTTGPMNNNNLLLLLNCLTSMRHIKSQDFPPQNCNQTISCESMLCSTLIEWISVRPDWISRILECSKLTLRFQLLFIRSPLPIHIYHVPCHFLVGEHSDTIPDYRCVDHKVVHALKLNNIIGNYLEFQSARSIHTNGNSFRAWILYADWTLKRMSKCSSCVVSSIAWKSKHVF